MKYAYFVVEGQHDIAVIGRILKRYGVRRVQVIEGLEEYWLPLIPTKFPIKGDLLKRVPVPVFFQGAECSVAVYSAGGDSKIPKALINLKLLDAEKLFSTAIFCDSDKKSGRERFEEVANKIAAVTDHFATVSDPGTVQKGERNVGIYVFPDNESQGTLENLLLDCAGVSYSDLLMNARDYVGTISSDHKDNWGQSDEGKVLVGVIANALKPGKANQVSIQDNNWICADTVKLPSVAKLDKFISELLNLEPLAD